MPAKNSGFSLIETLVALAVLSIFFAAIVVIFNFVTNLVGEARIRTLASALAAEKMEVIRNLDYELIGTQGGIPPGALLQNELITHNGREFLVKTNVVYIDDPYDNQVPIDLVGTDYKRVKIEVTWGGAFPSLRPVTFISNFVPNGVEGNQDGGTLVIHTINASGLPVPNADVTIVNDQVDPVINYTTTSNANGQVILPGAPICSACYKVTVTKSGHSSDRTYGTEEVINPLKPHGTVLQGEITELTFTLDLTAELRVLTTGRREINYPAFSGVQFRLKGSKTIGTNEFDEPVYKYDQAHSSGAGGQVTISGLEWDTYEIYIPNPSSIDLAGTNPISPLSLLPGQSLNLTIVTTAASGNNLLTIVQDASGTPIATATATLIGPNNYIATKSAGLAGKGDYGQMLFSNLNLGLYELWVEQDGYQQASASAYVNGDSKVYVNLQHE